MKRLIGLSFLSVMGFLASGCTTSTPSSEANTAAMHDESRAALERMEAVDPGVKAMLEKAEAAAVFPNIGQGAVGVGGASGKGTVYQNGQVVGYATLEQASIGLQVGGQTYSELLIFETPQALSQFQSGKLSFGGDVSATVLKAGTAGQAPFRHGVAVYQLPRGGLMVGISIEGQKFRFTPASGSDERRS